MSDDTGSVSSNLPSKSNESRVGRENQRYNPKLMQEWWQDAFA